MSQMPSPQNREAWIARIRERARLEIPALLRSQRQRVASPTTPFPDVATVPTHQLPYLKHRVDLPETGDIPKLRETAIIPAINLLKQTQVVDVRETRELVSTAIHWFYHEHGCLPHSVGVNPMRYLTITRPDFFAVMCEDIGCYTVRVVSNIALSPDVVELAGRMWPWLEELRDSYL